MYISQLFKLTNCVVLLITRGYCNEKAASIPPPFNNKPIQKLDF